MNDANTQLILDAIQDLNKRFDALEKRMNERFDILDTNIKQINSDIEVIRKHGGFERSKSTGRIIPMAAKNE